MVAIRIGGNVVSANSSDGLYASDSGIEDKVAAAGKSDGSSIVASNLIGCGKGQGIRGGGGDIRLDFYVSTVGRDPITHFGCSADHDVTTT